MNPPATASAGTDLGEPVALPRGWRTATGPRRRAYLYPFAVFTAVLYVLFVVGFSWQATKDDIATDHARSSGGPLPLTVTESNSWSVYLELHTGVEQSEDLEAVLRQGTDFRARVTPAAAPDAPIPLTAATGGAYRVTEGAQLTGYGLGDVTLEAGEYIVSVPVIEGETEPAIAGFAVGPVPDPAPSWLLGAAGLVTVICAVWAMVVRRARANARRRLGPPQLPPLAGVGPGEVHG